MTKEKWEEELEKTVFYKNWKYVMNGFYEDNSWKSDDKQLKNFIRNTRQEAITGERERIKEILMSIVPPEEWNDHIVKKECRQQILDNITNLLSK